MDTNLSRLRFQKEYENLNAWVSACIGPNRVFQQHPTIFANLQQESTGKKFLLRVDCGENFPIEPADYKFVNSDTQTDDGSDYWPVYNTNAFKTGETPRWICIAGTLEYKKHHPDYNHDPMVNSISQTVHHVFLEINGW